MKKPDFFNKACAEKLGIDITVVKKVNSYFWKKGVKSNLSKAKYRAIFIKNFGTISVSYYKLNVEIIETIAKIRALRVHKRKKEITKKLAIGELTRNLTQLLKRRNEIAWELYRNRNEQNIGIPEIDTPGSEEHRQDWGGSNQRHPDEER